MLNKILVFVFVSFLLSCNQTVNGEDTNVTANNESKESFQLYQMSEMASFMEKMYAEHQILKQQIIKGELPDTLNYNLLNLYTAKMTDSTDDDMQYKNMAEVFIEYENKILDNPAQAKANFNQAVNLCISCHQIKCTGPIPRIKKLLIQ